MFRRTDKHVFANWWWTVDKLLLAAILALMFIGIILSLAASPAVAERLGLESFHFVIRHAIFLVPAFLVLIGTSLLDARQIRRLALFMFVLALGLTAATLFIGMEAKGAKRWLYFAGFSLQPSELLKPAFVVVAAWFFAEGIRKPEMPGAVLATLLLIPVIGVLIMQPDFGQTFLVLMAWGALFFMSGMSWVLIAGFAGMSALGLFAAYMTVPHVARRIERFINPESGDSFQTERAIDSFLNGGWLGRGPGEGTVKEILPDSHTDFIFAVAGEEFGVIFCLAIVAIFCFVLMRGLVRARQEDDLFVRLAAAGLIMLIGFQAIINMGVNLSLLPAKGMTLPFISYGGTSLLAVSFAMGMVLGLARRRPRSIQLWSADREVLLAGERAA